jgi:hypothetical protein
MALKKKYWEMTKREAWDLAVKLSKLSHIGSIEKVAEIIECAVSTIYRWRGGGNAYPSPQFTIPLRELAIKEGIIKA